MLDQRTDPVVVAVELDARSVEGDQPLLAWVLRASGQLGAHLDLHELILGAIGSGIQGKASVGTGVIDVS